MIIDTLTVAGIVFSALYLLTFLWFGTETLKVEEAAPSPQCKPLYPCEATGGDCWAPACDPDRGLQAPVRIQSQRRPGASLATQSTSPRGTRRFGPP